MLAESFRPNVPYVALFCGTSLISRMIRWHTRGLWSHAAIVIDGVVYEAREGRGVIKRRWGTSGYPDKAWTLRTPVEALSLEQVEAMKNWLDVQMGSPYDYVQVSRFLTRFKWTRRMSDGKWFCSELVFEAFKQVGVDLFDNVEAFEVPPVWLDRTVLLRTAHTNFKHAA